MLITIKLSGKRQIEGYGKTQEIEDLAREQRPNREVYSKMPDRRPCKRYSCMISQLHYKDGSDISRAGDN
jgi:hypothetical protein